MIHIPITAVFFQCYEPRDVVNPIMNRQRWWYNGNIMVIIYIYIMDYNGIFMVYHGILMGLPSGKRTACEVDNHI